MALELIDRNRCTELGGAGGVAAYLRARGAQPAQVEAVVREVIAAVRKEGEAALLRYTREFDWPQATAEQLLVPMAELDEAIASLDPAVYAALEGAIANVARVAAAQAGQEQPVRLPQGHQVVVKETPVASAALYVPGGRHPYASTVVMGTVTARAAGVFEVAVATPPDHEGRIDPCVLAACRMCGVSRIYRMGGAQAVAALAFGTDQVAPVQLVVGPGNIYVQEAKRQLAGLVGSDSFAGPSDLLVLFDGEAPLELLALDLAAQAEHGEGTVAVAATPDGEALKGLGEALEPYLARVGARGEASLALVEVGSFREGIELANAFAPEHLQLIGVALEGLAGRIQNAGCVLVGSASGTAFADYIAGSNHILPTAGAARFASALTPATFCRRRYEVRLDGQSARALAELAVPLAEREGFPLHARSMEARAQWEGSA